MANNTVIATEVESMILVNSDRREKRNLISWALPDSGVVARRRIVAAVLVEMWRRNETRLRNGDQRQPQAALRNRDAALQEFQVLRHRALVKYAQLVFPGRHPGDGVLSARLGHRVPRRVQHRDNRAHRGMNVAEDPHDAGVFERHAPRGARRIQADVEWLAAKIRKGIMEDQVQIRQVD